MIRDFIDSTHELSKKYVDGYNEMIRKANGIKPDDYEANKEYVEWTIDSWNKISKVSEKDVEKYNAAFKYFNQTEYVLMSPDSNNADSFAVRKDTEPDSRFFKAIIESIKNESNKIDKSLKELDNGINSLKTASKYMEKIIEATDNANKSQSMKDKLKASVNGPDNNEAEDKKFMDRYLNALRFAAKQMCALVSGSVNTYGKISRLIYIVNRSNTTYLTRLLYSDILGYDEGDTKIDRSYDFSVPAPPKQEEFRELRGDGPRRRRLM